jgi:hypothetical protein
VEDDRGAGLGPDGGGDHREVVVLAVLDRDVVRFEPALHEAGARTDAVELRGVVRDEALGQGAFLHGPRITVGAEAKSGGRRGSGDPPSARSPRPLAG